MSIYAVTVAGDTASATLAATLDFQRHFQSSVCAAVSLSWSPDGTWLSFQDAFLPWVNVFLVKSPSLAQLETNARLHQVPLRIEETTVIRSDSLGVEAPYTWTSAPDLMVAVRSHTDLVLVDTRSGQQRTLLAGIPTDSVGLIYTLALAAKDTSVVFSLGYRNIYKEEKLYVYSLPAPITNAGI